MYEKQGNLGCSKGVCNRRVSLWSRYCRQNSDLIVDMVYTMSMIFMLHSTAPVEMCCPIVTYPYMCTMLCFMQNSNGDAPLTIACAKGHADVAAFLMDKGAVVNFQSKVTTIIVISEVDPLSLVLIAAWNFSSSCCMSKRSFSHCQSVT